MKKDEGQGDRPQVPTVRTASGRVVHLDKAKKLHPDFPVPPEGLPEPGREHPPRPETARRERWQCGWWGRHVRNCSLTAGGCGWRHPPGWKGDFCPWCGNSMLCRGGSVRRDTWGRCHVHGAGTPARGTPPRGGPSGRTPLALDEEDMLDKLKKDGRPTPLDAYLYAKHDPELLRMSNMLAVLDHRLETLLERALTRDSSELWEVLTVQVRAAKAHRDKVESVFGSFLQALAQKDQAGMKARLDELGQLVREPYLNDLAGTVHDGRADWHNWSDVHRTIEERRKVTDSQVGQLQKLQQMVTVEKMLSTTDRLYDIVAEVVRDDRIRDPERKLNRIGELLALEFSDLSPVVDLPDGGRYWKRDVYEGLTAPGVGAGGEDGGE